MSTQALSVSAADAVSEDDYRALLAVLSASARGRAFLDEHVRRQRRAETAILLGAIERLETQMAAQPGRADVSHELNALAESVRSVRSQIDAVQLAAAVTQLAATLDSVQRRLSALISNDVTGPKPEAKTVQPPFALAITAVAARAIAAAESTPEEEPIKVLKAGTIPPPPPFAGDDFTGRDGGAPGSQDQHPAPPDEHIAQSGTGNDLMLQIMALSEEERLALFS
jgi:hypothetical protein